jgi:hypothetical protein
MLSGPDALHRVDRTVVRQHQDTTMQITRNSIATGWVRQVTTILIGPMNGHTVRCCIAQRARRIS